MSFSSQWLALREPIDHAARSKELCSELATHFADKSSLRITDIGSGTGSTIRALKPFLKQKISWRLIDNDQSLLEIAKKDAGDDNVIFTLADLSSSLAPIFEQATDIVTTSAFLDLVSESWLEDLVTGVTKRYVPFYAALNYDGTAGFLPLDTCDVDVLDAINDHQRTDKGFGPALGPEAAGTVVRLFRDAGYRVMIEDSNWEGTPKHPEFQKMLLDGWFTAASEMRPERIHTFKEWLVKRYRLIDEADASLYVGHKDILAIPE